MGIAIFGSIGTAIYRSVMADAVPAGVPHDVAEAARSTLGAATAMAEQLPGELGVVLLGRAREAFVQGLQMTAFICATLMIVTAVAAVVLLRKVGANSNPGLQSELSPIGSGHRPLGEAHER